MRKGDVVGNYRVLNKIGKGGFGIVFLATTITPPPKRYALKFLEGLKINEELKIGLGFGKKSPYLVKFKEIIVKEEEDEEGLIIVEEYCDGGDLLKIIEEGRPPSDIEIFRFVFEIGMAVKTLHDENIIHRDLKPSNIFLLVSGGYKLGDYGLARTLDTASTKSFTYGGADGYVAPEILEGKPYSKKVDIFSFGATLIEFITGESPFRKRGEPFNVTAFVAGAITETARMHKHQLMGLARRMIAVNPTERPTIEEILATPVPLSALRPFFCTSAGADAGTAGAGTVEREEKREWQQERAGILNPVDVDAVTGVGRRATGQEWGQDEGIARVVWDVKVYDDTTDLEEIGTFVVGIRIEGVMWGTVSQVDIGVFGMKMLRVVSVIDRAKVPSPDIVEEAILANENIQAADISSLSMEKKEEGEQERRRDRAGTWRGEGGPVASAPAITTAAVEGRATGQRWRKEEEDDLGKARVVWDVKVYEDTTDLEEIKSYVVGIRIDGVVWGEAEQVDMGVFGMKMLRVVSVIDRAKVPSPDIVEEAILANENIQAADIKFGDVF